MNSDFVVTKKCHKANILKKLNITFTLNKICVRWNAITLLKIFKGCVRSWNLRKSKVQQRGIGVVGIIEKRQARNQSPAFDKDKY